MTAEMTAIEKAGTVAAALITEGSTSASDPDSTEAETMAGAAAMTIQTIKNITATPIAATAPEMDQ